MKKKSLSQFKGGLLLTTAAFIWGTAFVAQSVGMDYIGPFLFNAVRNYIGAAALLPFLVFMQRRDKAEAVKPRRNKKTLITGGIICGIILCAASLLQQVSLQKTSVGKAGFLTALYVVIVPVLSFFIGKKPGAMIWISVCIALIGAYLMSIKGGFVIDGGDLLVIISALFYSIHIMAVDYFSPKMNGVILSCLQFFVCGTLSFFLAFMYEPVNIAGVLKTWMPLLYTGILSSGVAYTLQILGQRLTSPAVASVTMSLESVFAALAGWILLAQTLTLRETMGAVLVFAAVLIAQLPSKKHMAKTE